MFRNLLYSAILLVFCVMHAGCAGPAHTTGGLANGAQSEVERLKKDNESCRRIIGEKQAAIDEMNIEMTNLKDEVEDLKSELDDLKKERQQAGNEEGLLKDQISTLKEQTIGVEEKKVGISVPAKEGIKQEPKAGVEKKDVVQAAKVEKRTDPKMLKIKVLSGNGKISSAKALSGKLTKLGYRVENISMAPRSNFDVNTIYFAQDYKNEAQQIAAQLGGDTAFKPLTWPSVFHMIVVTGP